MIRLEMKKYNMILIEKQLRYQPDHQVKFINMNISLVRLPSNQQQVIEQAKFTCSPLRKAFEKQIKTIEDQGQKQIDSLQNLKQEKETKPIEDKSNNQPKSTIIFNELINKRKGLIK